MNLTYRELRDILSRQDERRLAERVELYDTASGTYHAIRDVESRYAEDTPKSGLLILHLDT